MPPEEPNAQEESQHSTEATEDTEDTAGTGAPGRDTENDNSQQRKSSDEIPDVTLDVPTLNLEEAHLQVDNLRTRISLQAELADIVRINVGVDAFFEKVELDLKGLEAQALLKANLENVRDILVKTLESLDDNPDLIENLTQQSSGGELEGVAGTVRNAYEKPQDENPAQETDEAQEEDSEAQEPEEDSAGEAEATDAARSKAEELNVDLAHVEGTGSRGRIVARDVRKAANQQ